MPRQFLLGAILFARLAAAQTTGATVSGVVRDSLARAPLANAQVQLVASDSLGRFGRTVMSDSLGEFVFGDVPVGSYTIGFFHPMLDSLGLEPTLRNVRVDGRAPIRADLAIPAPARLRAAICHARQEDDSESVIVGVVRDARGRAPVADATVTADWWEFSLSRQGIGWHMQRRTATTASNGWFSMCNVPPTGTVVLAAHRGADSTDRIDVSVPDTRFVRHELYLGPAHGNATDGIRLRGTVVTATAGTPIAGAQVRMTDGSETRANERGEWTLSGAPSGTRMIEVRSIGYYPARTPVNVVDSTPTLRIAMTTMKAVLDTVRITAAPRLQRNMREFDQRRRASGTGHFLTREDIDRRHALVTSDLFRSVPGLTVTGTATDRMLLMRGAFNDLCQPTIYVDGLFMSDLTADEIDNVVSPDEIAGVEVYPGTSTPPQFSGGMTGARPGATPCGSVVVWTRPRFNPPKSKSPTR